MTLSHLNSEETCLKKIMAIAIKTKKRIKENRRTDRQTDRLHTCLQKCIRKIHSLPFKTRSRILRIYYEGDPYSILKLPNTHFSMKGVKKDAKIDHLLRHFPGYPTGISIVFQLMVST